MALAEDIKDRGVDDASENAKGKLKMPVKKGTVPPWLQSAAKAKLAKMVTTKPSGKKGGFKPGTPGVNPFAKK